MKYKFCEAQNIVIVLLPSSTTLFYSFSNNWFKTSLLCRTVEQHYFQPKERFHVQIGNVWFACSFIQHDKSFDEVIVIFAAKTL
jgi:hypothetical protein